MGCPPNPRLSSNAPQQSIERGVCENRIFREGKREGGKGIEREKKGGKRRDMISLSEVKSVLESLPSKFLC